MAKLDNADRVAWMKDTLENKWSVHEMRRKIRAWEKKTEYETRKNDPLQILDMEPEEAVMTSGVDRKYKKLLADWMKNIKSFNAAE